MHGAASLGSLSLEQHFVALTPQKLPQQRRSVNATSLSLPPPQKPASSTASSPFSSPSHSPQTTSLFEWAPPDPESNLFLITPDGTPIDLANPKRNKDLRELFPAVLPEEMLVDDYACAWQKDILLQGRMYLTDRSVLFIAKIIWTYSICIPYSEITSIEKKTIAGIFANAIEISTSSAKHFFASFISRDSAFELLARLWTGFPNHTIQPKSPNKPLSTHSSNSNLQNSLASSPSRKTSTSSAYRRPLVTRTSISKSEGTELSLREPSADSLQQKKPIEPLQELSNQKQPDSAQKQPQSLSESLPQHSHTVEPQEQQQPQMTIQNQKQFETNSNDASASSNESQRDSDLSQPQPSTQQQLSRPRSEVLIDHSLFVRPESPSRILGLAEIANLESPTPDRISTIETPTDTTTIETAENAAITAHIIHQKHPVSLIKSETPKLGQSRVSSQITIDGRSVVSSDTKQKQTALQSKPVASAPKVSESVDASKKVDELLSKASTTLANPSRTSPTNKHRKVDHSHLIPSKPVSCPCNPIHERMRNLLETEIPLPIDLAWSFLYGNPSASSGFLRRFWTERCKHRDICGTDWMPSNTPIHNPTTFDTPGTPKTFATLSVGDHRRIEYIVPLTNPLGPKESRCQIHDRIVHKHQHYVCTRAASKTPDVPSGNCFEAITHACLTFVSVKATKFRVSCEIHYTKSTWIKMAIDHAVPEGLKSYQTSLMAALILYARESASAEMLAQSVFAKMDSDGHDALVHKDDDVKNRISETTLSHAANGNADLSQSANGHVHKQIDQPMSPADTLVSSKKHSLSHIADVPADNSQQPSTTHKHESSGAAMRLLSTKSIVLFIAGMAVLAMFMAVSVSLWRLSNEIQILRQEIQALRQVSSSIPTTVMNNNPETHDNTDL